MPEQLLIILFILLLFSYPLLVNTLLDQIIDYTKFKKAFSFKVSILDNIKILIRCALFRKKVNTLEFTVLAISVFNSMLLILFSIAPYLSKVIITPEMIIIPFSVSLLLLSFFFVHFTQSNRLELLVKMIIQDTLTFILVASLISVFYFRFEVDILLPFLIGLLVFQLSYRISGINIGTNYAYGYIISLMKMSIILTINFLCFRELSHFTGFVSCLVIILFVIVQDIVCSLLAERFKEMRGSLAAQKIYRVFLFMALISYLIGVQL